MRRRSIGARHGMKKLDALIARFADDVIRTVRAATLGELAELLASREAGTARIALPFPLTVRPALPAARSRDLHAADWLRNGGNEVSGAELPEVAEITDPERLLRVDGPSQASPRRTQRLAAGIPDASSRGSERPGDAPDTSPDRGSYGNGAASTELPMPGSLTDESTSSQLLSEPNGEPPPPSAPQATATVMLRANEALVRSSGAGIVIRRSKRA
jgi:hypothetical protein